MLELEILIGSLVMGKRLYKNLILIKCIKTVQKSIYCLPKSKGRSGRAKPMMDSTKKMLEAGFEKVIFTRHKIG